MYTMVNLFDCIDFQLPTLPFQRFSSVVALATNGVDVEPSSTIDPSIVLAGVFLSLVVIYFASKVGGEVCIRLNLPPVLGELVMGVVVGISALHLLIFPDGNFQGSDSLIMELLQATTSLNPSALEATFQAQSEVISVLAEMGVVILLFEIGLESDLKELIRVGPQATVVAVVGVAAPFIAGTAGLVFFFGMPIIPSVFAGAALTATSIGITAKVLAEIQQLASTEGQIIIGAAVLDDVLGIIVLAVVAGLARTGEVVLSNVVVLIVSAAIFLIGSVVLGRFLSPYFMAVVANLKTRGQLLISALIFAFFLAYVGAAIQLEAILGSFVAGLILAETDRQKELEEQVVPIADMFVPIFFVVVGARTDIGVLNPAVPSNLDGLKIAIFLIVVAIIGKLITGLVIFGKPDINRLAVGVGMIPRGEVGLVFASIGSVSGVLSPPLQAAIIVMVIITTFLSPPFLRIAFAMGAPASSNSLPSQDESQIIPLEDTTVKKE